MVVSGSRVQHRWLPRSDAMVNHSVHIHVDIGRSLFGRAETVALWNGPNENTVSAHTISYLVQLSFSSAVWGGICVCVSAIKAIYIWICAQYSVFYMQTHFSHSLSGPQKQMPMLDGLHMDIVGHAMLSAISEWLHHIRRRCVHMQTELEQHIGVQHHIGDLGAGPQCHIDRAQLRLHICNDASLTFGCTNTW